MSDSPVIKVINGSYEQLTRYAIVGIVSNLGGYLVYLMITYLGVAPKLTMTFLYVLGVAVGYIGNRNFSFRHKGGMAGSAFRYLIAHCFGYCINLTLLFIFVDIFGYPHQWVQAVAILIVAGFLFIAFKYFVFLNSSETSRS